VLSDDRYRRAAAAGGVGIWDWNLVTGEIYVDRVLKEMLGYEDHEVENTFDLWQSLVHPDDRPALTAWIQAHIAGGSMAYELEHRMLHRDGSVRWFAARASVTRNDEGLAVHMAGTDTDITVRKRGEEALRQAEEINRRIAASTGDCVKILDLGGRIIYINPEGVRQLELEDASTVLNRPLIAPLTGEALEAAERAIELARGGGTGRFQFRLRTGSGAMRWFDIAITPITDAAGAVVQLLAVSRDVTERVREEAFRGTQHEVLEMIARGCALTDVLDHVVRTVEGQSPDMRCSVLLLDEDGVHVRHGAAPRLPAEYIQAIDGMPIGPRHGSCGTAMFLGTQVVVSDVLSDPLWADYRDVVRPHGLRACWSTPIRSPQRKVLGSFAVYYDEPRSPRDEELRLIDSAADVTRIAIEQHRAQQALRHSEARNSAILRAIPDWMFLTTVDGVFLDYHARNVTDLHAPPSMFLGKNVADVLPPPIAQPLVQAFSRASRSDEPEKVEYSMGLADGERYFEACIVRCDGDKILSIVRDITDRKRAEIEASAQRRVLAHLGRVAVLGELTGALAHELSQPLAAVLTNAQAAQHFLERTPPDIGEIRDALADVVRNNRRAGAVIDHLRALLRKESVVHQPINVNDVVREVVELAHSEVVSRRIRVTSTLNAGIPTVLGDRIQLQQVVLNLVLNACDAMSEIDPARRELILATGRDNGFVQVVVSDRGTGIPHDQLTRVFEPFVTFRHQGLGLGLAISRSIVEAHHGSIRAENNADAGATFRCFLPVAETTASADDGHSEEPRG
jgi:PAS domain S-box-containing protein